MGNAAKVSLVSVVSSGAVAADTDGVVRRMHIVALDARMRLGGATLRRSLRLPMSSLRQAHRLGLLPGLRP